MGIEWFSEDVLLCSSVWAASRVREVKVEVKARVSLLGRSFFWEAFFFWFGETLPHVLSAAGWKENQGERARCGSGVVVGGSPLRLKWRGIVA